VSGSGALWSPPNKLLVEAYRFPGAVESGKEMFPQVLAHSRYAYLWLITSEQQVVYSPVALY